MSRYLAGVFLGSLAVTCLVIFGLLLYLQSHGLLP